MGSDDRFCPECDERYTWYETMCPDCGVALVADRPGGDPLPDGELVTVFEAEHAGAVDLAKLALEQEGIEYVVAGPERRRPLLDDHIERWMSTAQGSIRILVLQGHADKARELLADLQNEAAPSLATADVRPPIPDRASGSGLATIHLHDAESGGFIGRISESQLEILRDGLEQESQTDQTYYVDAATIDMLADRSGDATLVDLLRGALRGREGVEIRWSEAS